MTQNDMHLPAAAEIAIALLAKGIQKVIIINIGHKFMCSDPNAAFLIPFLENSKEWRDHEAVMLKVDEQTQCIYIVSIHSSRRGRPEGGVRLLNSPNFNLGLNDCLALSFGMTKKNAYADIWEGGAKSVIIPYNGRIFDLLMNEQAKTERENIGIFRELLWRNYGGFISEMQGAYLVGEDMNLNSWDMRCILKYCVHSSCHSKTVGGADNPSPKTALGIFKAVLATCEILFPTTPTIKGKKIIMKGVGLVGTSLAEQLYTAGAILTIYDTDPRAIERIEKISPDIEVRIFSKNEGESAEDFSKRFKEEELTFLKNLQADIFSPNAKSGTLTKELIAVLNVKAIVGAENAQIAKDDEDYVLNELQRTGIVYVPDSAINSMGVFSASQEHIGIVNADFEEKANSIYEQTKELLNESLKHGRTPFEVFIEVALEKAKQPNPLYGHRGVKIIQELLKSWS